MRVRRGGIVVLALVLVAGVVAPGAAVSDPGGSGDGLVAVGPEGFSDVDEGSVHGSAVGVLAASGVFGGTECGEGLFCPDEPLRRSVMAVWLVRILDGADTTPVVSGVFSDVDYAEGYAPFADRLSELGVTRGCATGPLRYCPDRSVTRGQMAAFLVRAFGLEAGSAAGFTDVETGHTFVDDIDALAASRITAGCATGPLRYCPERHVTRAQMATFLARAAGLVDLPAPVGTQPEQPPPFDPFSTPTVSDIDLERLADAVETLDEEAVCPPTRVRGSLADVAEVVRISGGCLYVEYVPLGGRTVDQVREELASDPEVHAVDLPVIDVYPSDFPYDDKEQWHLERIEANNLWYGGVGADGLRVLSGWPAGADVVVAVIDDGVDGSHPDLDANLITRGDSCHRSPHKNNKGELNDHGTHVAGIIGAERNGRDVVGVAPDARILPIKIHFSDDFEKDQEGEFIEDSNGDRIPLDSHCYSLVRSTADAVRLAIEQGADVINMSYGGPIRSMTDEAVLRAAMMRDIVPVAAAGNCGRNTAASLNANNCSSMHNLAKYPAAYPGVIAVANTTVNASGDDERAATSTANRHVGIAAPGSGILSTVPTNSCGLLNLFTCTTADKTGTSMAAPVIAGVVAHMKARFPKASVSEIRQALYATAQQPGSGGTGRWTPEFGWGIVTPAHAIWDLTKYFFSCDAVLGQDRGLVAYDIDVDIDADGDTVHDDRVELFERRDVWVADGNGDVWCRVAHNAAHPAWSPDGQHLTFAHRLPDPHQVLATNDEGHTVLKWVDEGRVDIWAMPAAGGPWRRVTDTEAEEYDLDWSRSGQIVYTANTGAGFEIWVVDASGDTPPRNLTGHLAGSQFQPSWSPVGTRIAYASDQDGDNDIWVMNADGTGHRNLTTGNITVDGRSLADSKEEQPAWSPDGTRIVYVSDRSGGDNDVWVMNADGTGHRVLHDNNGPESKPEWSPDGSRIIFVHNTGRPGTDDDIWTMDAKTGLDWELITTATAEDLRFNAAAESNPAWSPTDAPPPDDRQVRIWWGSDATSRPDCPTGEVCLDLRYEFIGTWDPAPYTLECWSGNNRSWVGQWSGQPEHGCYYWGEPAHVVIDGIQSNTITWTAPPPPDDRQIRIWWGSDATSRADCPTGETCWNLRYEYIGTWEQPPYTLECWVDGQQGDVFSWSGRETTGCYYWGAGTAQVIIDDVRSNQLTIPTPDDREVKIFWGSDASSRTDCPTGETCLYLQYEYIGSWDPPPYTLECWTGNNRAWTGTWAGQPEHGCHYAWGEPAHVVIDGIRSNTINWTPPPTGDPPPLSPATSITAGSDHSCALRADGTAECWGSDSHRQSTPPAGVFTAISAGTDHTCGLRTDGTVECWGSEHDGTVDPPNGAFTSISTRYRHTCGLRANNAVECWGRNDFGQTDVPDGAFAAVTAGSVHSCGIRTDGTIECWGQTHFTPPAGTFTSLTSWCGIRTDGTVECFGGYTTPPHGRFTALSSGGYFYSCGLRTDSSVQCWGHNYSGESTPPTGRFTAIASGVEHSCGIRTDGTIECWGHADGRTTPPDGTFASVSASGHSCGIKTDGTIECWGADHYGKASPPPGEFSYVGTGGFFSCGLTTNGTIKCWGNEGYTRPPDGIFTKLSVGHTDSCAIRTDHTVECWGIDYFSSGQATAPTGSFEAIAAGAVRSCGIKTDGSIECWGEQHGSTPPSGTFTALTDTCGLRTDGTIKCWRGRSAPAGRFTALSSGFGYHRCGLRANGTVECWGNDWAGQATPPAGTFTAISAGWEHTCGVRPDGTITCWGYNDGRATPPGGRFGPTRD